MVLLTLLSPLFLVFLAPVPRTLIPTPDNFPGTAEAAEAGEAVGTPV